jgi:putative tributyrin esterase
MAIMNIEYYSKVLDMYRQVQVIYPDLYEVEDDDFTDIPVLYLLHGMGGNQNSWTKRTAIERLLRKTNLMVVMPSTDLGWYTNTASGLDFYDSIALELPEVMRHFFPNMTTKREKSFIAGLSMGGYGAYKIAFKTNAFSYAASFSGALSFSNLDLDFVSDRRAYWQGIFGNVTDLEGHPETLISAAKQFDGETDLYAWCGKEDFIYPANLTAMEEFDKLGLSVEFKEEHGCHEWYYWEKQLEVFLERLPIKYVKEGRLS